MLRNEHQLLQHDLGLFLFALYVARVFDEELLEIEDGFIDKEYGKDDVDKGVEAYSKLFDNIARSYFHSYKRVICREDRLYLARLFYEWYLQDVL